MLSSPLTGGAAVWMSNSETSFATANERNGAASSGRLAMFAVQQTHRQCFSKCRL
jgi:hypothetical protein